jgi:hypothetical protein
MKRARFISGIYNYCDYWCDRCAFTRRCRNFATGQEMEEEARGVKVVDDATQAAFWNRLAGKLCEARVEARAKDWMSDAVFDPGDEADAKLEARQEKRHREAREHPLVRLAHTYMHRVGSWLKTADGDLKAVAQGLLEAAGNKFSDVDYEEEAREIGELIDVVAWYHTLMPPKLSRAMQGLLEKDDANSEMLAEIRTEDANGSGKVVLVAVERSIAAWVRLREILPKREDEILEMLSLLSRLQRGIHSALPGAQAFLRPGFDTPGEDGGD